MMENNRTAQLFLAHADEAAVLRVISAVNQVVSARRASRAAVVVACAQILAQVVAGEDEVAPDIRDGIHALIDGCAMQVAVEKPDA